MGKKEEFLKIFKKAEKRYKGSLKRLAGEGWGEPWRTLIVTIMSAQSRDETTIPIAEELFKRYDTLEKLSRAKIVDVLGIFKSMNYNKTKAKHVISAAHYILEEFGGKIPDEMDELVKIPGVGRKTANLVLWEAHRKQQGICVDTHVHRISNVFGFVDTKTPEQTEMGMMEVVPRRYWGRVNRVFVLWGKDVTGWDRERLLKALNE